jgi:hypothetical protein
MPSRLFHTATPFFATRAEKTEMASLIKKASSEGNTKHGDLEDGNNLDFVIIAQPVGLTTAEDVRANDPSLNQSTHGGNPFLGGVLLFICLLIMLCIVFVYMNPKQWLPTTMFTLNIIR